MSKSKGIVNTIMAVITLTLAAKFFGFFRDALLGSKIGASYDSDAYIMALNSTTIIFLSIGSAISTASIPLIVKKLKRSIEETNEFLNGLITMIFSGTFIISVLGIIFAPALLSVVAKGFGQEKMDLVIDLTRIMFPSLIFIGIAYIFVAFLQSKGKFIIPTLISFPFNMVLILYLILFLDDYGIIGLAYATLIGWSLQLLIQVPFAIKSGFKFNISYNRRNKEIKGFFISLIPIIFVTSIHQINILVDNMYASTLGHGKVSAVYYANILYQAIVTTTVYGISAVMFPKFNLNLTSDNKDKFRDLVLTVIDTVLYLLIPMSVGLMLLDDMLIALVFERGQFSAETTAITSMVLSNYALGMIGFGVIDILNKAFYSLDNTKTPVIVSITVIITNLFLSKVMLGYLGFKGVAIATSISLIIGALTMVYLFKKKIHTLNIRKLLKSFMKITISSCAMAITIIYTKGYLINYIDTTGTLGKIIFLGIITLMGIIVFSILTILMKERTSIYIFENYFVSKLRKNKND